MRMWIMWDSYNGLKTPRLFANKRDLDAALKEMYDEYTPKFQETKVPYKTFLKELKRAGLCLAKVLPEKLK